MYISLYRNTSELGNAQLAYDLFYIGNNTGIIIKKTYKSNAPSRLLSDISGDLNKGGNITVTWPLKCLHMSSYNYNYLLVWVLT